MALGAIIVTPSIGWDALRQIDSKFRERAAHSRQTLRSYMTRPGRHVPWIGKVRPICISRRTVGQIDRFLLAVRLVTGASVQSAVVIPDAATRISGIVPYRVDFQFWDRWAVYRLFGFERGACPWGQAPRANATDPVAAPLSWLAKGLDPPRTSRDTSYDLRERPPPRSFPKRQFIPK